MDRLVIAAEKAMRMRPGTADSDVNVYYLSAKRAVKAVLDELRKPTKRMLREGNKATTDGRGAEDSWPAMIDAVLDET